MPATKEWSGTERREFCTLCKLDTERGIKSACGKAKIAMWLSVGLLATCFVLSGIAWSAKSDVANQKEILTEIRTEQKGISKDLNQIAEFIQLLKDGKIVVYEHARNGRDREDGNRSN